MEDEYGSESSEDSESPRNEAKVAAQPEVQQPALKRMPTYVIPEKPKRVRKYAGSSSSLASVQSRDEATVVNDITAMRHYS